MRDLRVLTPSSCFVLAVAALGCSQNVEEAPTLDLVTAEKELREVAEVVLNENFAANRIDPFVPHIAEDVTVFGPGGGAREDGGEKMIEGLRQVAANKTTHRWEEKDWKIQVYSDVGIVTFIYDHDSTRNGVRAERTSRATYVFHRRGERWVLVHDHTSALRPDPASDETDGR
jgi:ketosteroid isomerase-like protein